MNPTVFNRRWTNKAILIAILIYTIFCNGVASVYAEGDLPKLVEKVRKSVAVIYSLDSSENIIGLGTGFIIRGNRIITNRHVIIGASSIKAKFKTGTVIDISHVLAPDRETDLAVLFCGKPTTKLPHLLTQVDIPALGEDIFVIGNPLGLEHTLSTGIIAAIRQHNHLGQVYQLTAPISKGSSGSPVFDMKGYVLGVVTFYVSGGQNLNFAIPIGLALRFDEKDKMPAYVWSTANPPDLKNRPISHSDNKKRREGPVIKKSRSGICHDTTSRWYRRTKKFKPYDSIKKCLVSGGRLPRR